jgi:Zn-dependent peptidase ImmA (M78 family)
VFVKDLSEYGKCDVNTQTIYIREGMNEQTTKQTFYHELVHAIMFSMGHTQHDEIFTDAFGGMLLQFEKTAKI